MYHAEHKTSHSLLSSSDAEEEGGAEVWNTAVPAQPSAWSRLLSCLSTAFLCRCARQQAVALEGGQVTLKHKIAEGGFSLVYYGTFKEESVAVKKIIVQSSEHMEEVAKEVGCIHCLHMHLCNG